MIRKWQLYKRRLPDLTYRALVIYLIKKNEVTLEHKKKLLPIMQTVIEDTLRVASYPLTDVINIVEQTTNNRQMVKDIIEIKDNIIYVIRTLREGQYK